MIVTLQIHTEKLRNLLMQVQPISDMQAFCHELVPNGECYTFTAPPACLKKAQPFVSSSAQQVLPPCGDSVNFLLVPFKVAQNLGVCRFYSLKQ